MPCPQLIIDLESLYGRCYDRVRNFPKLDKHLLGKDILYFINETEKSALLAIFNKSYAPLASANFDLAKKSLRLAMDRKLISEGWYADQMSLIVAIGKAIGGIVNQNKTPRV